MTESTVLISVKVPARIAAKLPVAGNGRSRFIVEAIEEKAARKQQAKDWKPVTARGKRMAALLAKGRSERAPLLSESEIEAELSKRKGRHF
ncbi:MAG TPA: hypothetical protein VFW05_03040 [Verrucomicrobiae bacterium]|nr:hypothetical protein [Verrucomicrobiae bacterium]